MALVASLKSAGMIRLTAFTVVPRRRGYFQAFRRTLYRIDAMVVPAPTNNPKGNTKNPTVNGNEYRISPSKGRSSLKMNALLKKRNLPVAAVGKIIKVGKGRPTQLKCRDNLGHATGAQGLWQGEIKLASQNTAHDPSAHSISVSLQAISQGQSSWVATQT